MVNLRRFQYALADKKLNPYIDITNRDKVLIHFIEEVGEFVRSYRKDDRPAMLDEVADVLILLAFVSESLDIDLEECIIAKLQKNIEGKKFFGKIEDFE